MNHANKWAKEIGSKIRQARKSANLVQADVAKGLGLSVEGVSSMERGSRLIGLEYLLRLPAILNCKLTDLLPDSVVSDYDRQRAADPRLREVNEGWRDLPEFLKDGITGMVRDARKEHEKER